MYLIFVSLSFVAAFIALILFWYNGVLEVTTDDNGDSIKMNINEYDIIKKRRFMILIIKRK